MLLIMGEYKQEFSDGHSNKEEIVMEWSRLMNFKPWFPLKDYFPNARHVEGDLYWTDQDQYVLTSPVDKNFQRGKPSAPFVTLAYWAISENAIRRCVFRDLSVEVSTVDKMPPDFFLMGTNGTYEKLLTCEKIKKLGHIAEQASYDSFTGKFIHKVIDATQIQYYFLDKKVKFNERPYAIEYRF